MGFEGVSRKKEEGENIFPGMPLKTGGEDWCWILWAFVVDDLYLEPLMVLVTGR